MCSRISWPRPVQCQIQVRDTLEQPSTPMASPESIFPHANPGKQDPTRPYQTLPDPIRPYQTLPDLTRLYQTQPPNRSHQRLFLQRRELTRVPRLPQASGAMWGLIRSHEHGLTIQETTTKILPTHSRKLQKADPANGAKSCKAVLRASMLVWGRYPLPWIGLLAQMFAQETEAVNYVRISAFVERFQHQGVNERRKCSWDKVHQKPPFPFVSTSLKDLRWKSCSVAALLLCGKPLGEHAM